VGWVAVALACAVVLWVSRVKGAPRAAPRGAAAGEPSGETMARGGIEANIAGES
jgi:hypothetical protein